MQYVGETMVQSQWNRAMLAKDQRVQEVYSLLCQITPHSFRNSDFVQFVLWARINLAQFPIKIFVETEDTPLPMIEVFPIPSAEGDEEDVDEEFGGVVSSRAGSMAPPSTRRNEGSGGTGRSARSQGATGGSVYSMRSSGTTFSTATTRRAARKIPSEMPLTLADFSVLLEECTNLQLDTLAKKAVLFAQMLEKEWFVSTLGSEDVLLGEDGFAPRSVVCVGSNVFSFDTEHSVLLCYESSTGVPRIILDVDSGLDKPIGLAMVSRAQRTAVTGLSSWELPAGDSESLTQL